MFDGNKKKLKSFKVNGRIKQVRDSVITFVTDGFAFIPTNNLYAINEDGVVMHCGTGMVVTMIVSNNLKCVELKEGNEVGIIPLSYLIAVTYSVRDFNGSYVHAIDGNLNNVSRYNITWKRYIVESSEFLNTLFRRKYVANNVFELFLSVDEYKIEINSGLLALLMKFSVSEASEVLEESIGEHQILDEVNPPYYTGKKILYDIKTGNATGVAPTRVYSGDIVINAIMLCHSIHNYNDIYEWANLHSSGYNVPLLVNLNEPTVKGSPIGL